MNSSSKEEDTSPNTLSFVLQFSLIFCMRNSQCMPVVKRLTAYAWCSSFLLTWTQDSHILFNHITIHTPWSARTFICFWGKNVTYVHEKSILMHEEKSNQISSDHPQVFFQKLTKQTSYAMLSYLCNNNGVRIIITFKKAFVLTHA